MRVVGEPFWLSPKTWKQGYIYSVASELRQRPGTERFSGYFESDGRSPPPHPASGANQLQLVVLR